MKRVLSWLVLLATLATACSGPAPVRPGGLGPEARAPAAAKRLVAAISGEPKTLSQRVSSGGAGGTPGLDALGEPFRALLTAAQGFGLHAYPFKAGRGALVYWTPQENGKVGLISASATSSARTAGRTRVWVAFDLFSEFYSSEITREQAVDALSDKAVRDLTAGEMTQFIANLERILGQLRPTHRD